MNVATPADGKRAFSWIVFLGTPINQVQRVNCTGLLGQSSGAWCVILYTVRSDGLLHTPFASAKSHIPTAGTQKAKMDCTWVSFLCAGKTMPLLPKHTDSV